MWYAGRLCLAGLLLFISAGIWAGTDYTARLAASQQTWQQLKQQNGAFYEYQVEFSSWTGFGYRTRIVVENDRVTQRYYSAWNQQGESTGSWQETSPDLLGSHSQGAPAEVMESLYQQCGQEVLRRDPAHFHIYFKLDEDGLLAHCLAAAKSCADDCSQGVSIKHIHFDPVRETE